jgi:hypothetical protein
MVDTFQARADAEIARAKAANKANPKEMYIVEETNLDVLWGVMEIIQRHKDVVCCVRGCGPNFGIILHSSNQ